MNHGIRLMMNRKFLTGTLLLFSFAALYSSVFSSIGCCSPGGQAAFAAGQKTIQGDLVQIDADHQTFEGTSGKTFLKGNVNVSYKNVKIRSAEGTVESGPSGDPEVAVFYKRPLARRIEPKVGEDQMRADIIRVHLKEDAMSGEGHVVTHVTTVANDPFLIRSDTQQFDNVTKTMLAKGQVFVDYKGTKTYSPKAMLQVGSNGKAEKAIFSGGAKLEDENSVMNGDKITVMVESGNLTAEHNVKTQVKLKDETGQKNLQMHIDSDYQQYDKASDMFFASGNVRLLYDGYEAVGPKANFRLKDGQVDQILLTGRSIIVENDRKVVADKITIIANPRHFDAVGNVKTQFKQVNQTPAAADTPPAKQTVSGKGQKPVAAKSVSATRKAPSKKLVPDADLLED